MGGRRERRHINHVNKAALLVALKTGRDGCIRALGEAPIRGDLYRACDDVLVAIDRVAEVLTGNVQHFVPRPHSTHDFMEAAPGEESEP